MITFWEGDCRETLISAQPNSVDCVVTSPPYFEQRDYGFECQIGHEDGPPAFVSELVRVFRLIWPALKDSATVWINIGDSVYSGNGQPRGVDPRSPNRNWMRKKYRWLDRGGSGLPKKSLLGVPWMLAHALQADGWTIRQEIIWNRVSALAEPSVKDRPYRQHETIFLISKSRRYWFDRSALPEESVWTIPHERGQRGHIAPFPEELARRCILAGCPPAGVVLDPFGGSGTVPAVALSYGRAAIMCEASPASMAMARARVSTASVCSRQSKEPSVDD